MSSDSMIQQSQSQQLQQANGSDVSSVLVQGMEPSFKTNFKSSANREGGTITTQHSLTLENYNSIMRSEYYNHQKLAPPPLIYAKDKRILIELAKLFALRHGYRIVINKNDSRRVILLCSRHGTNKVSSRSKKEKPENSTFSTSVKTHKCQCPFRAEIQLKQRRKLWILKPITMEHNHDEVLQLPITIDNSTSTAVPAETTDGGSINKKYTVSSFCNMAHHLECFFETNDFNKLLGLDEVKDTMIHHEDGLKLITAELLNNTTITDSASNNNHNDNNNNKRKQNHNSTPESEQLLANELLKVAKRARNSKHNNEFILLIKNVNPKSFFEDFPNFSIDEEFVQIKFDVLPNNHNSQNGTDVDDSNYYNFQLLNADDKVLLNEDVISLSKEMNDITTQDLIKKINQVTSSSTVERDAKVENDNRTANIFQHHDHPHEDDEADPDIANITAVAVKAQEHAAAKNSNNSELFVDPELTK